MSRALVLPVAVAVAAGSVALCGAAGASARLRAAVAKAPQSSSLTTSRAKPAPAMIYMRRSGTGNAELSPMMMLPPKWTVAWHFDCQNALKHMGTFTLSIKEQGRQAVNLTHQTGLGGGGQTPYTQSGRYSFGVTTSCGWDVTVQNTPLRSGMPARLKA